MWVTKELEKWNGAGRDSNPIVWHPRAYAPRRSTRPCGGWFLYDFYNAVDLSVYPFAVLYGSVCKYIENWVLSHTWPIFKDFVHFLEPSVCWKGVVSFFVDYLFSHRRASVWFNWSESADGWLRHRKEKLGVKQRNQRATFSWLTPASRYSVKDTSKI